MKTTKRCKLIIAASEHHADMLYVAGMFVPDPFIAIEIAGEWHGLFSPLEIDRAKKSSKFDHCHIDSPWRELAKQQGNAGDLLGAASAFMQQHQITEVIVPDDFPLKYAETLRAQRWMVRCQDGPLFPQRIHKREDECKQLARAERLTKQSMQQAEKFIAACSIGDDLILRHPDAAMKKVTAQDIRQTIDIWLMQHDAMPSHTIVACGKQSSDPHNTGSGYIYAHQPIIIDIFPRLVNSGYWGDMTRTFCKGAASTELKAMYHAVKDAQKLGLSMVQHGVKAAAIHTAIQTHFVNLGFTTGSVRGKQCGFFHGTGHGVGLDIHEAPRVSTADNTLESGQVITIEPGLYYPHIGGVRLEDLVIVRADGCQNLTNFKCQLEIA
ncbi:MAG: aminopeptidase P family protein [Zetaproteobacteria bacterium]|nr:aminopeptidase P family protein [Zetaproteobacteria bacterium]